MFEIKVKTYLLLWFVLFVKFCMVCKIIWFRNNSYACFGGGALDRICFGIIQYFIIVRVTFNDGTFDEDYFISAEVLRVIPNHARYEDSTILSRPHGGRHVFKLFSFSQVQYKCLALQSRFLDAHFQQPVIVCKKVLSHMSQPHVFQRL